MDIEHGKTYAIVGESGSGKTTALRLMNGLLRPTDGDVLIKGETFDYSKAVKVRRKMGYSIQGSGLFPHMTIKENMGIIAKKEGWSDSKISERIEELCSLVNLPSDKQFLKKKPRQISGGQQQRVGIARALFMSPEIMLMDEPFGALDPITREEIQNEFLSLQERLKLTIVLVTHDLAEAFRMSDEVILFNQGKVEQKGKPSEFMLKPKTEYVEKFMQTHSPGHLLKGVKLYSVIYTDLFMTQKTDEGFLLMNKDQQSNMTVNSFDEVIQKHSEVDQQFIYWVDDKGNFLSFQQNGTTYEICLKTQDHILKGMKTLVDSDLHSIPVVNNANKLLGVFSKGALDAI